jgi:hypothetical protein
MSNPPTPVLSSAPCASSEFRSIRQCFRRISPSERSTVLARLVNLLLEAASTAERDDREH